MICGSCVIDRDGCTNPIEPAAGKGASGSLSSTNRWCDGPTQPLPSCRPSPLHVEPATGQVCQAPVCYIGITHAGQGPGGVGGAAAGQPAGGGEVEKPPWTVLVSAASQRARPEGVWGVAHKAAVIIHSTLPMHNHPQVSQPLQLPYVEILAWI